MVGQCVCGLVTYQTDLLGTSSTSLFAFCILHSIGVQVQVRLRPLPKRIGIRLLSIAENELRRPSLGAPRRWEAGCCSYAPAPPSASPLPGPRERASGGGDAAWPRSWRSAGVGGLRAVGLIEGGCSTAAALASAPPPLLPPPEDLRKGVSSPAAAAAAPSRDARLCRSRGCRGCRGMIRPAPPLPPLPATVAVGAEVRGGAGVAPMTGTSPTSE